MTRESSAVRPEEVRSKILTSAKELFVQQGYKKTTIRQIVNRSGILTGSIYYFYKNKAEIFQALVLSLLDKCIHLITENFHDASPAFQYAAMCAVELKAVTWNNLVRECYYEGYTSNMIFQKMTEELSAVSEHMFRGCGQSFNHEDYYLRTLLIKGAMRSYVAELYFNRTISPDKYQELLLREVLFIFGFHKEQVEKVLQEIKEKDDVLSDIAEQLIRLSIEQ
jgi:AcrR family transcriptional regulator